jgi:epoxyqueuosine reductase QueG
MAPETIERDFEGSPLRRAGTAQLARNAAIVARAHAHDERVQEALRIAAERWPEVREVVQPDAK